jgi:hypothetical protein
MPSLPYSRRPTVRRWPPWYRRRLQGWRLSRRRFRNQQCWRRTIALLQASGQHNRNLRSEPAAFRAKSRTRSAEFFPHTDCCAGAARKSVACARWTQTSRNDCAQGQDRAALKVTVAGFGCGVYQVVKLYVHRDRRQDPLRRNGPHPHGRAGRGEPATRVGVSHCPGSSTAPAELPTKPWRPSEPLSVGRWAARAAGLDLRASRPRPHGCWQWWPPGRHGRTAGRLPAPLARRTGTPDRRRDAGANGKWSNTSRRRAGMLGTAGRRRGNIESFPALVSSLPYPTASEVGPVPACVL